jgi:hypothetical protein
MASTAASRAAGTCAIAGSLVLLLGTSLHPQSADPNDAVAAFTEYAADRGWIASHLLQLAGVALMVTALLELAHRLREGPGAAWARIAAATAVAGLAIAAALQAVDGIALKRTIDAWAASPAPTKEVAFFAAFAVRQVEVGLAAMLSLALGIAAVLYGIALLADRRIARWLGAIAIFGGAWTTIAGVAIAYTGFSDLEMAINMPASLLLLAWMIALGALVLRGDALGAPRAGSREDA